MHSNLRGLFNHIRYEACQLRLERPNADGRALWRAIVSSLGGKADALSSRGWAPLDPAVVAKVRSFPQTDTQSGELNEVNHFLLQQVNISARYPAELKRILQIALNIGQWEAGYKDSYGIDYNSTRLYLFTTHVAEGGADSLDAVLADGLYEVVAQAVSDEVARQTGDD